MKKLMNQVRKNVARVAGAVMGGSVVGGAALAEYDIGKSNGGGFLVLLETIIQDWVNFATGPWAMAVVGGSIVAAVTLWVAAPKSGVLGIVMRAATGGIALLNIPVFIAMLQGL